MVSAKGQNRTVTSKDLAIAMRIDEHRVSEQLHVWRKDHKGYLRRAGKSTLPNGRWYYQYVITKRGEEEFHNMESKGYTRPYVGVTKKGAEMGMTHTDAMIASGLKKKQ
jgi:hypothetical protein